MTDFDRSRAGGNMTFEIFVLLVQDAFGTGAIYVLMALGIVLDLQRHARHLRLLWRPRRLFGADARLLRTEPHAGHGLAGADAGWACVRGRGGFADPQETVPIKFRRHFSIGAWSRPLPVGVAFLIGAQNLSLPVSILLTIALVLPLGPLLYRIVFQPIATAPVLVLLMVAVALHFAITGLALLYFGPEGLRTQAFVTRRCHDRGLRRSRSNCS